MATAKTFRDVLVRCAQDATKREPENIDRRATCFAAFISGALEAHGEDAVAREISVMLEIGKHKSADGA